MGVTLQQGFSPQSGPLDDRCVVVDSTARLSLPSSKVFNGLVVYETSTTKLFVLKDENNYNSDNGWIEITNQTPTDTGTGVGFPFEGSAVISGSLELYNLSLGSSSSFDFEANSSNFKVFKENGEEFEISNPPTNGLDSNASANNIYDIFNNSDDFTNLYLDSLLLLDLGSEKILDKIEFVYDSSHVTREIETYGLNSFDVTSTTLLNTALTENSASLLVEGATSPVNASNLVSTFNPIETDLIDLNQPTTTLVSSVPNVKKTFFRYYLIKLDKNIKNGSVGFHNTSNPSTLNSITFYTQEFTKKITTRLDNGLISSSQAVIGTGKFDTIKVTNLQKADGTAYTIGGNLDSSNFNNFGNDIIPDITGTEEGAGRDLGSSDRKWKNLHALNTFFGGIHEINLETKGLNQMQEGTVLSLQNGTMCPCEKEADPLVMGVVSKGENFPIVLGAEPVLVTGKVEEGDYIITSNVEGHGKGINPKHIYDQQLFGKIIAQAIEKGDGKSYTIKAMIRKM